MAWTIEFDKAAVKQFERLDGRDQKRIRDYLWLRVAQSENPRQLGKALQGSKLGDLWRYRVGDFRVICDLQDEKLVVLVLQLGHRGQVYR